MSFVDRHDALKAELAEIEREIEYIQSREAAGEPINYERVADLLVALSELEDEFDDIVAAERLYAEADAESYDHHQTLDESDISHEESRVYAYPDGDEVEVEAPQTLYENLDTGEHYIVDVANVGTVVAPGWHDITVYPRAGEVPFKIAS